MQAAFPSLKLATGEPATDSKPLFDNSKVGSVDHVKLTACQTFQLGHPAGGPPAGPYLE